MLVVLVVLVVLVLAVAMVVTIVEEKEFNAFNQSPPPPFTYPPTIGAAGTSNLQGGGEGGADELTDKRMRLWEFSDKFKAD